MGARPPLPTDIVAILAFESGHYANEAKTRDHLGKGDDSPRALTPAVEQWLSFITRRHAWVSTQGPTIQGLATARQRGNSRAWEIDSLILTDIDNHATTLGLLEGVISGAGYAGAHKVFLRLESGNPLIETARRAGFVRYLDETLFRGDARLSSTLADHQIETEMATPFRARTKGDTYPLFRLYNRSVPHDVRRLEAMTLDEWIATQERDWLPKRTGEFVLESEGEVVAWLRLGEDGRAGQFDILAHPQHHPLLDRILDRALTRLQKQRPIFSLVPHYAGDVASRLEARGFQPVGHYTVLVRRTVLPLTTRRLAPGRFRFPQPAEILGGVGRTPAPVERYTIETEEV
jgi:hypothetical protein